MATYGHHSKDEAADRLGYILPENDVPNVLLNAFSDAVCIAHDVGPNMWSVTLTGDLVRLNFGPVEVFLIFRDRAWFPVFGESRWKPKAIRRDPASHVRLRGSDVLSGSHVAIGDTFGEFRDQFQSSLESVRALFKNTDSYLNGAAKKAHARGLLAHLEERLGIELPRPGWDKEQNAPREAALFDEAVFTAIEPQLLSRGAIFRKNAKWSTTRASLEAARASGSRVPIIFGDAANSVITLIGWALVTNITIGDDGTHVEYEAVRGLNGRAATELVKLSDGTAIDEGYRRAYIPVVTPDFLNDEHDAPIAGEVRGIVGIEGRRRLITHLRIERERAVVDAAKAAWRANDPLLRCEVCGFSAEAVYGTPYVEAHHRRPLADLRGETTRTSIEDLACVCANCHRALHRDPQQTLETLSLRVRAHGLAPRSQRVAAERQMAGGEDA